MPSLSPNACARFLVSRSMWLLIAGLLLAVMLFPAGVLAQQPNRAGLVIRHGDGHVLYRVVEFSEPEITGSDLLLRSQIGLVTTAYAGIGQGVCSLDHEGCPAGNCFCKSYTNPAYYWRYYRLNPDGTWTSMPVGPDSRKIHNGDVDGWSWTAGDSGLPSTTIDAIASASKASAATPSPAQIARPAHSPVWVQPAYLGFAAILVFLGAAIAVVLMRGRPGGRS